MQKRILALVLSFSFIASLFACIPVTVSADSALADTEQISVGNDANEESTQVLNSDYDGGDSASSEEEEYSRVNLNSSDTTDVVDISGSISLSSSIGPATNEMEVKFRIPDGISSINGLQFLLELPTGFSFSDSSFTLAEGLREDWEVYADGTSGRIIIMNNIASSADVTIEEMLTSDASGWYTLGTLNLDVKSSVSAGTYTAYLTVEEIVANYEAYSGTTAEEIQFIFNDNDIIKLENVDPDENEMVVKFRIPEGFSDVYGLQFLLELPDGFSFDSITLADYLQENWSVIVNGNVGRIVLMNNTSGTGTVTIEESISEGNVQPDEYGFYVLGTIALNVEDTVKNGTQIALVTVEDIMANGQANLGDEEDEVSFLYCKHDATKLMNEKAPTCTEEGYSGDTVCSYCEELIKSGTAISATGHTTATYVSAKAATCTEKGNVEYYYCPICEKNFDSKEPTANEITDVTTDMIDHVGGEATCQTQAECSVCGNAYGELNPENHESSLGIFNEKEATGDEDGYYGDYGYECCQIVLQKTTAIPSLNDVGTEKFDFISDNITFTSEEVFEGISTEDTLVNANTGFSAMYYYRENTEIPFNAPIKAELSNKLYDNATGSWEWTDASFSDGSSGSYTAYHTDGQQAYATIVYDFKGTVSIDDILLVGNDTTARKIGKYTLFVGDNLDTLFTDPIIQKTVDNTTNKNIRQHFNFTESVEARYVAIRVLDPETQQNSTLRRIRLNEFNVYGSRINYETAAITADNVANYDKLNLDSGIDSTKAALTIINYEEDGTVNKTTKYDSSSTIFTEMIDHDLTHANVDRVRDSYGSYHDVIIELDAVNNTASTIYQMATFSGTTDPNRWLRDFEFYVVNSIDEIKSKNALARYSVADGTNPNRRVVIDIPEGVTGKYVALRIYDPENYATPDYARFEFNAFTAHNHEYFQEMEPTAEARATKATCTSPETYYYTCACGVINNAEGAKTFEYGALNPENHVGDRVFDGKGYDATCATSGMTDGQYYECCGAVYSEGAVIPATGHVNAEYKTKVAATCSTTGIKEHYYCSICNKNFDSRESTANEILDLTIALDPTNHEEGAVSNNDEVAATCKNTGFTASTYYPCCNVIESERQVTPKDPNKHEGKSVSDENAVAATCVTTGLTASWSYDCCGKLVTPQEKTDKNPDNHENSIIVDVLAVPATEEQSGSTAGKKHDCCGVIIEGCETTYYVAFVCDGSVVYTTEVVKDKTLSNEQIAAAKAKVINKFGYYFYGWSYETNMEITQATTFDAIYRRDYDTLYTVTVGSQSKKVSFDTKISLRAGTEALWKVNGVNYDVATVTNIYVFGDMEITAHSADEIDATKPFVSLLRTISNSGDFLAFVHAYVPEGYTNIEVGALYINSGVGLDLSDDTVWAQYGKSATRLNKKNVMTTLYNIASGKRRAVKAYAIIDGVTYYGEGFAYYNPGPVAEEPSAGEGYGNNSASGADDLSSGQGYGENSASGKDDLD